MDPRGGLRPMAPVKPFTWEDARSVASQTRQHLAKSYVKLRSVGAISIGAVKKYSQVVLRQGAETAEARRLKRLGPQPGDTEITAVYRLSNQEQEAKVAQAKSARQGSRQEVELSSLHQGGAQDSKAAERPPRSPESLKAAVLASKPPTQPSTAGTRHQGPSSSTEVRVTRPLTRVPSGTLDKEWLTKQAQEAQRRGQAVVQDVLYSTRLPRVPLRKRGIGSSSSAQESINVGSLTYPGEGWKLYWNTDRSAVMFDRYRPSGEPLVQGRPFEQLNSAEQKEVYKLIPVVKKLHRNNWDFSQISEKPTIGTNVMDDNGVYTFKDRLHQVIEVRRRGNKIEWGHVTGGTRKWKSFRKMPNHLQDFVRWHYGQGESTPTWLRELGDVINPRSLEATHLRKRGGSSSKSEKIVDSLSYKGGGWLMYHGQGGTLFTQYPPPPENQPFVAGKFSQLDPATKADILETIPGLEAMQRTGWNLDNLKGSERYLKFGAHQRDEQAGYIHKDRFLQDIRVRSRKVGRFGSKIFEFEYATGWNEPRQWAAFGDLPRHLQFFLKKEAESSPGAWVKAIPRYLRKRSFRSPHLRKRVFGLSSKSGDDHELQVQKRIGLRKRADEDAADKEHRLQRRDPVIIGSVRYEGERLMVTKQDGRKYAHFVAPHEGMVRTVPWSRIPAGELRAIEAAWAASGKKLTKPNGTQHFFYDPLKKAKEITIIRDEEGKVRFWVGDNRYRMTFSSLPAHLQEFLETHTEIASFIAEAKRG